jgi:hypothetical protein
MDDAALAQEIAEAVKVHAWEWDVSQLELEAIILKIIMKQSDTTHART